MDEQHHHGHHSPADAEPPAEPGYPEHPEIPHPAGELPGSPEAHHGAHGSHGGHGGHSGHAGHDKHAGHSVAMFRDKFWLSLLLTIPTRDLGPHADPALTGFTRPSFPGSQWIPPVFGTAVFLYGGCVFLQGALARAAGPAAGHDDADLARDHRRLRLQRRRHARLSRHAALGGAGDARHDHAARPLDRDAVHLPGAGRAQGAREAAAEHGRARSSATGHGGGADRRRCATATWCSSGPAPACPPTASCARDRARSTSR